MGYLNPEEFIPMAEKNGMILKIGEFVFRTVCQMMARERIWEKGIDYIEVNLSVVQCMQEDICEMLYGIMDEYEVPYSCINLEITETVLSKDILWDTMERMVVGGVTFSLDDYGTGYSNLTNILKYPFHIVKLDKSMVWSAMEDERAMLALKHTVAMVLDLDMYIVAEGVETEEMVKTLTELGCEYLQGYYFSRPVCEADFLEKLYGEK
jgi:EAL domain-containing protein (putative c-di-GMP-specific phosphodiesterase class I)